MVKSKFTLADLVKIIEARSNEHPDSDIYASSYIISQLLKGPDHLGRKIVEESVEVLMEVLRTSRSAKQKKSRIAEELSDLIFHMLILATHEGISLADIEDVLAKRYKSDQSDLRHLEPYMTSRPTLDLNEMLKRYQMSFPRSADIILVSHCVRNKRLPDAEQICKFSEVAKVLKVKMANENLKVKLAVPRGKHEIFESRREVSLVLPIVVILSSVVLPFCINILAAYVKDWLDAQDDSTRKANIQIDIAIRKTMKHKETWYQIKGKPTDVYRALKMLRDKTDRHGSH